MGAAGAVCLAHRANLAGIVQFTRTRSHFIIVAAALKLAQQEVGDVPISGEWHLHKLQEVEVTGVSTNLRENEVAAPRIDRMVVTTHPNHLSKGQPPCIVTPETLCINVKRVKRVSHARPKRPKPWSSSTC